LILKDLETFINDLPIAKAAEPIKEQKPLQCIKVCTSHEDLTSWIKTKIDSIDKEVLL